MHCDKILASEHGDGTLRLQPDLIALASFSAWTSPFSPNGEVDTAGEAYNPDVNFVWASGSAIRS